MSVDMIYRINVSVISLHAGDHVFVIRVDLCVLKHQQRLVAAISLNSSLTTPPPARIRLMVVGGRKRLGQIRARTTAGFSTDPNNCVIRHAEATAVYQRRIYDDRSLGHGNRTAAAATAATTTLYSMYCTACVRIPACFPPVFDIRVQKMNELPLSSATCFCFLVYLFSRIGCRRILMTFLEGWYVRRRTKAYSFFQKSPCGVISSVGILCYQTGRSSGPGYSLTLGLGPSKLCHRSVRLAEGTREPGGGYGYTAILVGCSLFSRKAAGTR